jgi:hypothetical protein
MNIFFICYNPKYLLYLVIVLTDKIDLAFNNFVSHKTTLMENNLCNFYTRSSCNLPFYDDVSSVGTINVRVFMYEHHFLIKFITAK